MFVQNRFHLSYCTNIHPGTDWQTTFEGLKKYIPLIREKVAHKGSFGIGLRLSNRASEELSENDHLSEFQDWLEAQDYYVFTMNGFPYGKFHETAVKDKVHLPDWTSAERYNYTLRLFQQLARLIEKGTEGGISTSPISYKPWYKDDSDKKVVFKQAAEQMAMLAIQLRELENQYGSYLHLDIEPEPDGFLENTEDVINFYQDYLLPAGTERIRREIGIGQEMAKDILLRYICVCYDICHFSLAYEEPEYTFKKFAEAGILVGKIQISAALKILANSNPDKMFKSLSQFNEPTYLHQVTQQTDGGIITYSDLPDLLSMKPDFKELRAHFHVPIFVESFEGLYSTQDHILKVLNYIKQHQLTQHLEVETYTWDVLPADLKIEISSSIARELNWTMNKLQQ